MADNWDDIFNGEPEENNSGATAEENAVSNTGGSNQNEPQKPVKLGKWATAGLVVFVAIVAFILVITLRSCTIEKEVNSAQQTEPPVVETKIETEQAEKPVDSIAENPDLKQNNQDVTPTSPSGSNKVNSEKGSKKDTSSGNADKNVSGDTGIVEVDIPALGDAQQSKGIVVSKHSYLYHSSYVYGVSISVLVNENAQTVMYFCPKKTFDALNSTDAVNVVYQKDSAGLISIISISK